MGRGLERRWERYTLTPHHDHVHTELCWSAARSLSLEAGPRRARRPIEDDDDMDRAAADRCPQRCGPAGQLDPFVKHVHHADRDGRLEQVDKRVLELSRKVDELLARS